MILSDEVKDKIVKEYNSFVENQYAGKSKEERQELGQFYTPPELTIKMIEKYDNLEGNILDPTVGAGGLLAACIIAGAKPENCYGIEIDKRILDNVTIPRLSALGVPVKNLHHGSALNEDCYNFDLENYTYDLEKDKVTAANKTMKFGVRL